MMSWSECQKLFCRNLGSPTVPKLSLTPSESWRCSLSPNPPQLQIRPERNHPKLNAEAPVIKSAMPPTLYGMPPEFIGGRRHEILMTVAPAVPTMHSDTRPIGDGLRGKTICFQQPPHKINLGWPKPEVCHDMMTCPLSGRATNRRAIFFSRGEPGFVYF